MKKMIRSPTNRRNCRKCVFALMCILFCFLQISLTVCAADTTGANVYIAELPEQSLPTDIYTPILNQYFSESVGYLCFTDPTAENSFAISPDYRLGKGLTATNSEIYAYLTNIGENSHQMKFTLANVTFVPDDNDYSMFVIFESQNDIDVNTYFTSNNAQVNVTDAVHEVTPLPNGKKLHFYGFKSDPLLDTEPKTIVSTTPSNYSGYLRLWCAGASYGSREEMATYIENAKLLYNDIYRNYVEGGEGKMTTLLTEIIQLLFGGLTGAATALGGGANTFVTSLFVGENNTLAVYGGLVVIFAGVALAIGFTTRIFTWLTSLGN